MAEHRTLHDACIHITISCVWNLSTSKKRQFHISSQCLLGLSLREVIRFNECTCTSSYNCYTNHTWAHIQVHYLTSYIYTCTLISSHNKFNPSVVKKKTYNSRWTDHNEIIMVASGWSHSPACSETLC